MIHTRMRQPIVRQGFGYYRALLSDPDETDRLTAVNRRVAGSNPARGAITILYKATLAPQTPLVARHQQPVSDVRDDGNRRGARAADRLNFAAPGISPRDDEFIPVRDACAAALCRIARSATTIWLPSFSA